MLTVPLSNRFLNSRLVGHRLVSCRHLLVALGYLWRRFRDIERRRLGKGRLRQRRASGAGAFHDWLGAPWGRFHGSGGRGHVLPLALAALA